MKTRSWILGAAVTVTGLVSAQAQVDIGFTFATAGPVATLNNTSGTPVNFSVSAFSIGQTFATISGSNPENGTVSTGYVNPIPGSGGTPSGTFNYDLISKDGAYASGTSSYYSVTVTPSPGFRVRFTDFDFGAYRTSIGATSWLLAWSSDSFATPLVGTTAMPGATTWTLASSSPTAATSATAGAPVEFRLYTFGGTGATGTTASVRIDDLKLQVAAVPEASDCALFGSAAIVGFTWWRRSKKSVKQA